MDLDELLEDAEILGMIFADAEDLKQKIDEIPVDDIKRLEPLVKDYGRLVYKA